ncbi:MAG: glucose-1-phosphate thymidylyltransferase RfbA [Alphaproteobacteria bacterium]
MKGIILAGGNGTRLSPMTNTISKQILPIYDKPMIYYPLSTLMRAGIQEILIISSPRDLPSIKALLGTGNALGLSISYKEQTDPNGIAEAFLIGEEFIGSDPVCLILGDNFFYGEYDISEAVALKKGAYVLAYHVQDPERYGVVDFDKDGHALSIEEKPINPQSNWAVTGLYFYDNDVIKIAKNLIPSARGELEITDVNKAYLARNDLNVALLKRGCAWLDAGTPDSLIESAQFVQTIEKRQGMKIACLEEIAFQKGFISRTELQKLAEKFSKNNDYGKYLQQVLREAH